MAKVKPLPYIGNLATKEFHKRSRATGACQIGEIKPENRVEGKTQKEMHDKGLDACGNEPRMRYKSRH